ncbi:alternative protein CSNK1E-like protein [Leptotrombidium deliense]|uniref:Alternative protein CSNK1E-like protein n=1 Tax=Leptotrombidium deliense TaxID=299467 RepID=A0A443RU46_9ACAR|nr:alternative protein CSNK1E-like protein [Leptotrombidium deliense]
MTWRVWATCSCTSTWAPCPGRVSKQPPSARSTSGSARRCRRPLRSSAKATPLSSQHISTSAAPCASSTGRASPMTTSSTGTCSNSVQPGTPRTWIESGENTSARRGWGSCGGPQPGPCPPAHPQGPLPTGSAVQPSLWPPPRPPASSKLAILLPERSRGWTGSGR